MGLSSLLKLLILFSIIILSSGIYFFIQSQNSNSQSKPSQPTLVNILGKEKVKYPQDYTMVMIGDSMTETLGNSDELKKFLVLPNQNKLLWR